MKKAWLAYVSLTLLSVLIGLMLAGGPGALGSAQQPDRFPPFTSGATEPAESFDGVVIGVVNASGVDGRSNQTITTLTELGYGDPVALDGADFPLTVIFFSVGMRSAAAELATGIGLPSDAILPGSQLPELSTDQDFDLVVMLGTDTV